MKMIIDVFLKKKNSQKVEKLVQLGDFKKQY